MKIVLIVVLFELILLFDLCCAYMPVYHVANQDLLKGILLGALLTTHKHPPHFLNVMPMPYGYNNHVSPLQPQPYGYSNPTQASEHQPSHAVQDTDYKDRPTEQSAASSQQLENQQQESQSDRQQDNQAQNQHHHHQQQPQQEQYYPQQHKYSQQQHHYQQQQQQQRAESLFEPIVTDPTPTPPVQRSEPNIPSLESIQKNLGFPGHSVILMILPSFDTNKDNPSKEPNRTETTTETPEQEQHSSEEDMISEYENTLKTNAVKIGSKHLNARGWKPVPKTTTATTTTTSTEPTVPDFNPIDRYNRFKMNKYIERSQFGLRNKDLNQLNRDINQYYSIDQMHD